MLYAVNLSVLVSVRTCKFEGLYYIVKLQPFGLRTPNLPWLCKHTGATLSIHVHIYAYVCVYINTYRTVTSYVFVCMCMRMWYVQFVHVMLDIVIAVMLEEEKEETGRFVYS